MQKTNTIITAILAALTSCLGVLAVPVYILAGCNIIDYLTGLYAAKYRGEEIKSYKGFRGIAKKICMWLLILVGAMIDVLLEYTIKGAGIQIHFSFLVSIFVAIWLVLNEIISILENMIDIGVSMPPFLAPLVKRIRRQIEDTADIMEEDDE